MRLVRFGAMASAQVIGYAGWVAGGGRSEHLERVRSALSDVPQTRREIAERAEVSTKFSALALDSLVELGEARLAGERPVERTPGKRMPAFMKPAKLYIRA